MPVYLRKTAWLIVGVAACAFSGCESTKVASLESQNRVLAEQSRAQLAEIANLKAHSRKVEDQLISAEQRLAEMDQPATRQAQRNSP